MCSVPVLWLYSQWVWLHPSEAGIGHSANTETTCSETQRGDNAFTIYPYAI